MEGDSICITGIFIQLREHDEEFWAAGDKGELPSFLLHVEIMIGISMNYVQNNFPFVFASDTTRI